MHKIGGMGHTFGVRVYGTSSRRFLRFLSLTAFQAEGCGGGFAANFIMPPAAVTSTSSIIIILTLVHPFATSWPSSPKGDARTLRDLPFCVIWHDTHSGDWLAALASPYPASPDFSTGKRVTRFSGRFASLRIVFPCHPYAGGRIKHREKIFS